MPRIMIVDDDNSLRDLVKNLLGQEGFEVVEAKDGLDCLEQLLEGERPDLILLDIMMPKMDGWDVSRKIKENEVLGDIPICMLTAKTTTMDALVSLESAHAEWHLNKPVTKKVLLDTVNWLLAESKKKKSS